MQYLKRTIHEFLTLGADEYSMIGCWINAAYATHQDMKGHTGGIFPLGGGALCPPLVNKS